MLFCVATTSVVANSDENFPFRTGEKLTYAIVWGPFGAGHATLRVAGIEPVDGQACYHLVGHAQTSGFVDLLYHVESEIESWLDTSTLVTRRFRQRRQEGAHRGADDSHYDYAAGQIVTTNLLNGKLKLNPLPGPGQDMLSAFYYLRTLPLQFDHETSFAISLTGTNYDVHARIDERKQLYFRPTGDIPALRVEPQPTFKFIAAGGGRMWFWVSDDNRKLPLLLVTEMKYGSIKLVLTGIESAQPTGPQP